MIVGVRTDDHPSQMCKSGRHSSCRHNLSARIRLLPGPGLRASEVLCPCQCHAGCPLISAKPAELSALCTCYDHRNQTDRIAERERINELQRMVLKKVAERTPVGSDPALVRDDLQHELITHGLEESDKTLDYWTSQLVDARNGNTLGLLRSTFGWYRGIWKMLREGITPDD